jgi:hypothetical protein
MTVEKEEQLQSPYCQICSGCGEEGCCSPLVCQQHPNGDYCGRYLDDLKFGYHMNVWFFNNILDKIPEELKKEYMKEWDEQYSHFYGNCAD